jgi:putative hydrolase of the HAD superfamily
VIRAALFDIGNVVLFFSHERMCRQLAEAFGIAEPTVRAEIFDSGFASLYDRGLVTTEELWCRLRAVATRQAGLEEARQAAADIFELNEEIVPVLRALRDHGVRLVVLSNTCEVHASHFLEHFPVRALFDELVLSHEVGASKPDPVIFERAVEVAGCAAGECFYTDDIEAYVAAARELGVDSELFVGTAGLRRSLGERGLPV